MIFWILAKFSKETTTLIYANVNFENLPEGTSVASKNSEKLSFEMQTNGFKALSYSFNDPSISIDLSKYYKEGDSVVVIEKVDLVKLIASQLDNGTGINNLSSSPFIISLDRLETRRVPVKLMAEIQYREGYRSLGNITVKPDSVTVIGPSNKIGPISYIETKLLSVKNASEQIDEKLTLVPPEDKEVSINLTEVTILVEVEEFTQKQFKIPIDLINVPQEVEVRLLPDEIAISFDIAMSHFNAVSKSDFKLVCDYKKRNEEESFLLPVLKEFPKDLYNVELATKRVEYLIFK